MNWDLPKQIYLKDRENKLATPGDCWRCCIAAILQRDALTVPHFVARNGGLTYETDTQTWLAELGFTLIRYKSARAQFPRMHGQAFSPFPIITCGPSPRSRSTDDVHAVVYFDGKLVYDPHPDGSGLTGINEEYLIVPSFPFSVKGVLP